MAELYKVPLKILIGLIESQPTFQHAPEGTILWQVCNYVYRAQGIWFNFKGYSGNVLFQ